MSKAGIWIKLAATAFFWGMTFHLAKFTVGHLSPESSGAWRFLLAAVALVPFLAWREGINWAGLRRNAGWLLVMSAIGIFAFNLAFFHGIKRTSPVNGALIAALMPAITALFSAWINQEKVSRQQLIGYTLAFAGVVTVVSRGSLQALLALHIMPGDLLVLAAVVCWAIYSVIPRRFIKGLAPLQITAATVAAGSLLLVVTAESTTSDFLTLPPLGVSVAMLAIGLLGTALPYIWWNDGVGKVGPAKAAIFINLVPIFATLIGVVLGQPISLAQLAGAVLVVGGVLFASLGAGRAQERPTAHSNQPVAQAR